MDRLDVLLPTVMCDHPAPVICHLNVQGRGLRLGQDGFVRLKRVLHFSRDELLDLLRSTAGKGARVEEGIQFAQDGAKEFSATNALQQVVVLAVLLDIVGCLVGKNTDLFVGVLARKSLLHTGHDNVLSSHERKLIIHPASDDLGVDNKAGSNVVQKDKTGVGGQGRS